MKHSKTILYLFIIGLSFFWGVLAWAQTDQASLGYPLEIPLFNYAQSPNIADYIANIYRLAALVVVPLVIVVIIIAGIQWIAAAGDQGKIKTAKSRLISGFVGLGLVLCSYIILNLVGINALVLPEIQYIAPIQDIPLNVYDQIMSNAGLTPSSTDPAACKAIGEQVAKEMNIPPCFFTAIETMESGCKPNAVGHDENAGGTSAHSAFIASGGSVPNKDKPMCATPPNFCLDWRWSHGFGPGQYTFRGNVAKKELEPWCAPDGQPSRAQPWVRGGKCLTVPQVLDVKTSLEIAGDWYNHYGGKSKIHDVFYHYNSGPGYADRATSIYQKCCQEKGGC